MPYKNREDHRQLDAKLHRDRQQKHRAELLGFMGGKCVRCGYDDYRALAIDHVNGGGTIDRRKFGGNYFSAVLQLVKSGSKDYQVLCSNCNTIKRHENDEIARKY